MQHRRMRFVTGAAVMGVLAIGGVIWPDANGTNGITVAAQQPDPGQREILNQRIDSRDDDDRDDDEDDDDRGGPKDRRVRVASYNIHHGSGNDECVPPAPSTPPGPDCALDLERVAAVIRQMDVDVVGLQEVDRFWARSGYVDQPAELGRLLHMKVCYGANLDHQPDNHADRPHQYGTAILSRRPIQHCENTFLPKANPNGEQRGLLHAVINVRGARMHVYNTHLHTAVADRAVQVPAVDALIGQAAPSVLVGDFNAQPTETTMAPIQARFQDAWVVAGGGDGFTYPATPTAPPNRRIDYIFASPDVSVSTFNVEITPDAAMAADHYPLASRLEIPRHRGH